VASFSKLPSGLWRAQVARRGVRSSRTFATKGAAQAWATREEASILDGAARRWPAKTLSDAMLRYEKEVTPGKGAAKFEKIAFGLMREKHPELCAKVLSEITPDDLGKWRDERLKTVSGSTVLRYVGLLRNVWTVATQEWGWCPEPSPWRKVRMPEHNPPRTALNGWREIRVMLRKLNYLTGKPPSSMMEEVAYAWLIALRTGMRAAEVRRITPDTTDLRGRVVTLHEHKTKKSSGRPRFVPISKQAARLIALCPQFTVSAGSLDALFRKARAAAGLSGFTFHDSRATALTLLSRRVDVLTLARISGHKDIRQLQVYYRTSDEDIARMLDKRRGHP
jgi:integrase